MSETVIIGNDNDINKENSNEKIEEFKQACELFRHYSNMRFAIITVYIAITTAILSVIFGNNPPPDTTQYLLNIGGLLFTIIFLWFQEVAIKHLAAIATYGETIETSVNFKLFANRGKPKHKIFYMAIATRILYSIFAIFWIFRIILHKVNILSIIVCVYESVMQIIS